MRLADFVASLGDVTPVEFLFSSSDREGPACVPVFSVMKLETVGQKEPRTNEHIFYGILIFIQLLGQDSLVGVIVKGHLSTEETKLLKKSSATDRPTLQPNA